MEPNGTQWDLMEPNRTQWNPMEPNERVLTGKRGKVEEVSTKVGDLRKSWLNMFLEILHGHGGEVKELILHKDVGTRLWIRLVRRVTNVPHDTLDLVQNLHQILLQLCAHTSFDSVLTQF